MKLVNAPFYFWLVLNLSLRAAGQQCTLTTEEITSIATVIADARIWVPSAVFPRNDIGYSVRWVREHGVLYVAGQVVGHAATGRFAGVTIPVFQIGPETKTPYRLHVPGEDDDDAVRWLTAPGPASSDSLRRTCLATIAHAALARNQPRNKTANDRTLASMIPLLGEQLKTTYAAEVECSGWVLSPKTLERRALGRVSCAGTAVPERNYFWLSLTENGATDRVFIGWDRPGNQAGAHAYGVLKHRPKLPFTLRVPR